MPTDRAPAARTLRLVAGPSDAGRRLDDVLAHALGIGRRAATRLVEDVRVNGRRAGKGVRLAAGDVVVVPEQRELLSRSEEPLDVVRTLDDVLVIAKPAGLPSVALRGARGDSLAARIATRHPECATVGRVGESGLAHRLDTGTSGLLLAARRSAAYAALRADFRAHRVTKEYLVLVGGRVERPTRVTLPVGQHRASRRRMRALADPTPRYSAQEAVTEVEPLRVVGRRTLVCARSTTGVRHQIRVHLASVGHPLVNDSLYGGELVPELPGFLLHASALRWRDPATGARQEDALALPEVWSRLLDVLAGSPD